MGNGFSTRFMWRANGDMEVYAYTPGKTETFGKSLGRGFFRFETDRAYTVEQVLKLNTPGLNDGSIVVNVDGKEVFRDTAVNFRLSGITHIDSVMFSTFF